MAVSIRMFGVLGTLGVVVACCMYYLAGPERESIKSPGGNPRHYESRLGLHGETDLLVSDPASSQLHGRSLLSTPNQSDASVPMGEVPGQPAESIAGIPSGDFGEEIQLLEKGYNARVTEICTELAAHGIYDVLSRDAVNEEVELPINGEILQSFRTVVIGDYQEMRQFDFSREEFPDLYMMRQHIEIITDLYTKALAQEGNEPTPDR